MGHLRGLFCERDEIGIPVLSASSLARFKALTRLARPTGKHPGVCEVRRRRAHATTASQQSGTHALLARHDSIVSQSVFTPIGTSMTVPCFDAHRCTASIERKVSLGYMSESESPQNWLRAVAECPGASPREKDAVQTRATPRVTRS